MNYTVGTKVFGDWIIKKEIGSGSYGVVYEIEKNSYGVVAKSALKVIRIPASKADVKTALSEGMDEESLVNYFEGCVEEIVKEIAVMSGLKNHPNIVTYEDHHVEKNPDEFGWNILIRMELLTSLQDYQLSHKMTEDEIVQMAKDICNALVYCQDRKIVHRDIKPENIFVNELGQFKLGDFGVARTVDKTMGGLSKKGTEGYMAPEVYLGKSYGASVDIYSLGLMMYRLLNRNRMPFLPQAPKPITFQDRESSLVRRMQGEALPQPLYGSEELKRVILKACAYKPEDRYRTAQEMLDALNRVCKNISINIGKLPIIENQNEEYEVVEEKGTIGIWGDSNELRKRKEARQDDEKEEDFSFELQYENSDEEEKDKTIGIMWKENQKGEKDTKIDLENHEKEEGRSKKLKNRTWIIIASICIVIAAFVVIKQETKEQPNTISENVEKEISQSKDEVKDIKNEEIKSTSDVYTQVIEKAEKWVENSKNNEAYSEIWNLLAAINDITVSDIVIGTGWIWDTVDSNSITVFVPLLADNQEILSECRITFDSRGNIEGAGSFCSANYKTYIHEAMKNKAFYLYDNIYILGKTHIDEFKANGFKCILVDDSSDTVEVYSLENEYVAFDDIYIGTENGVIKFIMIKNADLISEFQLTQDKYFYGDITMLECVHAYGMPNSMFDNIFNYHEFEVTTTFSINFLEPRKIAILYSLND